MMKNKSLIEPIVLASSSPRRNTLLKDLNIPFIQVPSYIDEVRKANESPLDFAKRAAQEKGEEVRIRLEADNESPWILSADTIVVLDDQVLLKPKDFSEAKNMIRQLAGKTHLVITGYAITKTGRPPLVCYCETKVTFHTLTETQIERYAMTKEGMDKAGAYAVQGYGTFLVDRIEGNYFNVVGLPVSLVVRDLIEIGALPDFPL